MTIATTGVQVESVADGVQTEFIYNFWLGRAEDLKVYVDTVLQATNSYSIRAPPDSDNGPWPTGGSIEFDSPPDNGAIVKLSRHTLPVRLVGWTQFGPLNADDLNFSFDQLIGIIQEWEAAGGSGFEPGDFAPSDPAFILNSPSAALPNAQDLSALSNGPLHLIGGMLDTGLININTETTGTLAFNRLAITGTPDGTKYLNDAGAWATITPGLINISSGTTAQLPITRLDATSWANDSTLFLAASGQWITITLPSAGAPSDAVYITKTAHAGLSAEFALSTLLTGPLKVETTTGNLSSGLINLATETTGSLPIGSITASGTPSRTTYLRGDSNWVALPAAAPPGATYIVQTSDAGLTAEQPLAALSTGPLKVATGTGVLTSGAIDLSGAEVTSQLPVAKIAATGASATTFLKGSGVWSGVDLASAQVLNTLPLAKIASTGTPGATKFLDGLGVWRQPATSDLTGNLAVNRLTTTGTKSASTYLRGDDQWFTPAAGAVFDHYDVTAYGALGNGVADDGPAIDAAIVACMAGGGGKVYVPNGVYLVNTPVAFLTNGHQINRNLEIELHPSAVIKAKSTMAAGGMFQFYSLQGTVSSAVKVAGGSGYHVNDILTVRGGQTTVSDTPCQLKVLTLSGSAVATVSIQNAGAYMNAPRNPVIVSGGFGTGATFNLTWNANPGTPTDTSLYFHGGTLDVRDWAYVAGKDVFTVGANFRRVTIEDVLFYCGDDVFVDEGGDSAITTHGNTRVRINRCVFRGVHDVAIYLAHDREVVVSECYFYGCANGVSLKRNCARVTVNDNHFVDCINAVNSLEVNDPGNNPGFQAIITSNSMLRCAGSGVELRGSDHAVVANNRILDQGVWMSDGHLETDSYGIILRGCDDCVVTGNLISMFESTSIANQIGLVITAWTDPYTLIDYTSFRNLFAGNHCNGIYKAIQENASADVNGNLFLNNYENNATIASTITGATSYLSNEHQIRKGPTTMLDYIVNGTTLIASVGVPMRLSGYAKTVLPAAGGGNVGCIIWVSNDVGGGTVAFSDGTSWRRVADRVIIS